MRHETAYKRTRTAAAILKVVGPLALLWLAAFLGQSLAQTAPDPLLEYRFNAFDENGVWTSPSTGTDPTVVEFRDRNGVSADLRSADQAGVSGKVGDFALDLTSAEANANNGPYARQPVDLDDLDELASLTVSGWYRRTGAGDLGQAVLFAKRDGSRGFLLKGRGGGAIELVYGDQQLQGTNSVFPDTNEWVFFAVVIDIAGGEVTVYRGTEDSGIQEVDPGFNNPSSDTTGNDTGHFTIGNFSDGASGALLGWMDNITVWASAVPGEALLTQEEVDTQREDDTISPEGGAEEANDGAGLVDSVLISLGFSRSASDGVALSDTVDFLIGFAENVGTADDGALLDSVGVALGFNESTADGGTLSDAVEAVVSLMQAAAVGDAAGLVDSVSTALGFHADTSDGGALADDVLALFGIGVGADDGGALADNVLALFGIGVGTDDGGMLADNVLALFGIGVGTNDGGTLADNVLALFGISADADDGGTLADNVLALFGISTNADDGGTLADNVLALFGISVGVDDGGTLADDVLALFGVSVGADDGGTLADDVLALFGVSAGADDGGTLADNVLALFGIGVGTDDGGALADDVLALFGIGVGVDDGSALADNVLALFGISVDADDGGTLADDVLALFGVSAGADDGGALADNVLALFGISAGADDGGALADNVLALFGIGVGAEDGGTLGDGVLALFGIGVGVDDGGTLADDVLALFGISVGADAGGALADNVLALFGISVGANDGGTLADDVFALFGVGVGAEDGGTLGDGVLALFGIGVSADDGGALADDVLALFGIGVGVDDGGALADDVLALFGIGVGADDSGTLADDVLALFGIGAGADDGGALADDVLALFGIGVGASDGGTLADNVLALFGIGVGVDDGGALADEVLALFGVSANTDDGGTLADNVLALFGITANADDSGVLADNVLALFGVSASADGGGTLADTVLALFGISVGADDSGTLVDNVLALFGISAGADDGGTLADNVLALFGISVGVDDGGTLADDVLALFGIGAGEDDSGTLADDVLALFGISVGVDDTGFVSSSVLAYLGINAPGTGNVGVTDEVTESVLTPAPTPTPSPAPGPGPGPAPTPTPTPEPSPTPTAEPTPTPEPSPTATPEPTPTPEPAPTATPEPTPTTPEPTPTATPEPTPEPAPTPIIEAREISDEFVFPFDPVGIDLDDAEHPGTGNTFIIPPVGSDIALPIAVPSGQVLRDLLGGEQEFEGFQPPVTFERRTDPETGEPEAVIEAVLQREESGKEQVILRLVSTDFHGEGERVRAENLKAIQLEVVPQIVDLPESNAGGAPMRGGIAALISVRELKGGDQLLVDHDPERVATNAIEQAAAAADRDLLGVAFTFTFDVGSLGEAIEQADLVMYIDPEWTGRFADSVISVGRIPDTGAGSFLDTEFSGEAEGLSQYSARTSGFSTFALAALAPSGQEPNPEMAAARERLRDLYVAAGPVTAMWLPWYLAQAIDPMAIVGTLLGGGLFLAFVFSIIGAARGRRQRQRLHLWFGAGDDTDPWLARRLNRGVAPVQQGLEKTGRVLRRWLEPVDRTVIRLTGGMMNLAILLTGAAFMAGITMIAFSVAVTPNDVLQMMGMIVTAGAVLGMWFYSQEVITNGVVATILAFIAGAVMTVLALTIAPSTILLLVGLIALAGGLMGMWLVGRNEPLARVLGALFMTGVVLQAIGLTVAPSGVLLLLGMIVLGLAVLGMWIGSLQTR